MSKLERGQRILVNDLKALLAEAEAGEFGDFSNNKYPVPKMELVAKLKGLIENVKHGSYDDNTDE